MRSQCKDAKMAVLSSHRLDVVSEQQNSGSFAGGLWLSFEIPGWSELQKSCILDGNVFRFCVVSDIKQSKSWELCPFILLKEVCRPFISLWAVAHFGKALQCIINGQRDVSAASELVKNISESLDIQLSSIYED